MARQPVPSTQSWSNENPIDAPHEMAQEKERRVGLRWLAPMILYVVWVTRPRLRYGLDRTLWGAR
jgi:hypothetical protein